MDQTILTQPTPSNISPLSNILEFLYFYHKENPNPHLHQVIENLCDYVCTWDPQTQTHQP
jgi:hypothetical protein